MSSKIFLFSNLLLPKFQRLLSRSVKQPFVFSPSPLCNGSIGFRTSLPLKMIFIVGERRQGVMTPGGGLNRDKHLSQSGVLMTHSPREKRAQPLVSTLASPTQPSPSPGPALLALLIPAPPRSPAASELLTESAHRLHTRIGGR